MTTAHNYNRDYRYWFGNFKEAVELPNLIALQKQSYDNFLQADVPHDKRTRSGLHEIFSEIFPVKDLSGRAQLEYHGYYFEKPKYTEEECRYKGLTYSSSLKLTLRLIVWEFDQDTGSKSIRDIKEQDVYMGEIPIMTSRGTFVINGIERVIVSQMHRSPGVFFDHDSGRSHVSGKYLYAARIVPYRGSWFDFEFDYKDTVFVRIDRRRKISLSTFLFCIPKMSPEELEAQKNTVPSYSHNGYTAVELLKNFYDTLSFKREKDRWVADFYPALFKGFTPKTDITDLNGNVLVPTGSKMTPRVIRQLEKDQVKQIMVDDEFLLGKLLTYDFINPTTGEILIETGTEITPECLELFKKEKVNSITIFNIDALTVGAYLIKTFKADKIANREEALIDLAKNIRQGEPPTLENGEMLYRCLYSDPERYDLSAVGRVKINARLGFGDSVPDTVRILRKEDIFAIIRKLIEIKDGLDDIDDIDNLGNRRVRAVGELIENQYHVGILRLEKSIRERIAASDIDVLMPHDLVNAKALGSLLREFFGTSQLSQFMDQTNPLSEVAHKRRLSALGPGGLSRDRAVFEVRDVHPTHYGRICPVETPEGPNIGLINSLSSFARINKYGFIETPYRKVVEGKITNEVVFLTSTQETNHVIAHGEVAADENNIITERFVTCSRNGEYGMYPREEISYVDVSPKQLVSVAASLIPFLENDDTTRVLMGANMQRQAVPLINPDAPIVGTGMERVVARDSGAVVLAKRSGYVERLDSKRIVVRAVDENTDQVTGVDIYRLRKFERSNMGTCINQKPLVDAGQFVKKGDILADGNAISQGELALGKNALIAFMSWNGYNFEDSIVISEKISQEDAYTSVHIEELEIVARDTKLGPEEITRDIPNVADEMLRNLDESGIIYVGATVKPGDILVGKVTPKGEIAQSPEEKLLRAIFGEKASDVKDSSLRATSGIQGTVIDVRVFSRRGVSKDERTVLIERQDVLKAKADCENGIQIYEHSFKKSLLETLVNQELASKFGPHKQGETVTETMLNSTPWSQWKTIKVKDQNKQSHIDLLTHQFDEAVKNLQEELKDKINKINQGDDLSPGVLKIVKVYIAVKRKLQPGDKMAGRHGNKGVVSRVVPVEDMPFMEDGTPIDIIVNPLGVPSRMNVGQILETHLGAAAVGLGKKIQVMLDEHKAKKQNKTEEIRNLLAEIYQDSKAHLDEIKTAEQEKLLEFADAIKKGIPFACPVFSKPAEKVIDRLLKLAGFDASGQVQLYDGRTGDAFERKTTIGYMYILKLHHLVDDKMHARSIGPYSLVTQQPLGGKAQQGGQRFGEMEVWALYAYGAAYTLQEMLTVKSDDVTGRMLTYDAIIRDENKTQIGEPESFKVLEKEIQGLCCEFIKLSKDELTEELALQEKRRSRV